jgi:hypothetical protein
MAGRWDLNSFNPPSLVSFRVSFCLLLNISPKISTNNRIEATPPTIKGNLIALKDNEFSPWTMRNREPSKRKIGNHILFFIFFPPIED